jgi:hypothetical protein
MPIDPFRNRPETAHNPHWLHRLIRRGAEGPGCMSPGCTTCGATPFRKALRREAFRAAGRVMQRGLDSGAARHLAVALADLNPDDQEATAIENPARIASGELRSSPLRPQALEAILADTWAGALLHDLPWDITRPGLHRHLPEDR